MSLSIKKKNIILFKKLFNIYRILLLNGLINVLTLILLISPSFFISFIIIILNLTLLGINILVFIANLILEKNKRKETEAKKRKKKPPKPKLPEIDTNLKEKKEQKSSKSKKSQTLDKMEFKSVEKGDQKYLSEEDLELDIPKIPEASKEKKISVNSKALSIDLLKDIENYKDSETKVVLVNCRRCNDVIAVPILRKVVSNSKLPVVPISYIHKNKKNEDKHCITLYLDHDFDIRRERISDIIISEKII